MSLEKQVLYECYKNYQKGVTKTTLYYQNFAADKIMRSLLSHLEDEGILDIHGQAIGMAICSLTDYGISYCESF